MLSRRQPMPIMSGPAIAIMLAAVLLGVEPEFVII